jgi:pyruvate,orthophosphate dikinase
MILADDEGRRARRWPSCCRCSARLRRAVRDHGGLPVTIRLLDPPLHEFLPHTEEEIEEVAAAGLGTDEEVSRARGEAAEFNPMLGIAAAGSPSPIPEIAEMQARAIFEGARMKPARPPASRSCRKSWCR